MYSYNADQVEKAAKALLDHLEARVSGNDYERMLLFTKAVSGYVREADDDRARMEKNIALLQHELSGLREARTVALFWLAVFLVYQAYQTNRFLELAGLGILMYASFKAYEYYQRWQRKKFNAKLERRRLNVVDDSKS
jgi:hypothetical protein